MPDLMVLILVGSFILAAYIAVLIWGYAEGIIGSSNEHDVSQPEAGLDGEGSGADTERKMASFLDHAASTVGESSAHEMQRDESHSKGTDDEQLAERTLGFEVVQLNRRSTSPSLPDQLEPESLGVYQSLEYAKLKIEALRQRYRGAQDFRPRWFFVRSVPTGRIEWAAEGVGDMLDPARRGSDEEALGDHVGGRRPVQLLRLDLAEQSDRLEIVELGRWGSLPLAIMKREAVIQTLEAEDRHVLFVVIDGQSGTVITVDPSTRVAKRAAGQDV